MNNFWARIHRLAFRVKLRILGSNHEKKNKILRQLFWHIGENAAICTDHYGNEPYLIWIGNNVIVATGVQFVNHDASCWNMYRYLGVDYCKLDEKVGPIVLKDNCFIGARAILLPNVVVGKNSVVAAGAVVNKSIPDNEVWGGVPARFIMTVDEYANKNKQYYENVRLLNINDKNIKDQRKKLYKNYIEHLDS